MKIGCDLCRRCPYSPCFINNNNRNLYRNNRYENPVTVAYKDVNYDKKNISAELKIPVIKSSVYADSVIKINNYIYNDIMEFDKEMQEAASNYASKAQKEGNSFQPYKISTVYKLTYNKNGIISISIVYYENIGGMNYYIKTSYNYNLKNGKPLSLKDLFIDGVDYKKIVNAAIKEQLEQNEDKYFPNTIEKFKGIADDQPFYITDNGISIYFGFHQIAPKEVTIPVINIPYAKLSDFLKPDFLSNTVQL